MDRQYKGQNTKDKTQITVDKIVHRKLKIKQYGPHWKTELYSGAPLYNLHITMCQNTFETKLF